MDAAAPHSLNNMSDNPDPQFEIGEAVDVISGPHIGEHGIVFKHPLDLWPHAVWIDTPHGQRLIPAHRLAQWDVEGATQQD
jgi:hypothetical protein